MEPYFIEYLQEIEKANKDEIPSLKERKSTAQSKDHTLGTKTPLKDRSKSDDKTQYPKINTKIQNDPKYVSMLKKFRISQCNKNEYDSLSEDKQKELFD